MIIALDFDGVVHDRANPKPGRRMGPPFNEAKIGVEVLLAQGHEVFIHTCMAQNESGHKAVADWLDYYSFPYLEIVEKPLADVYIDDRGLHHWSWPSTLAEVSRRVPGDNEIRER